MHMTYLSAVAVLFLTLKTPFRIVVNKSIERQNPPACTACFDKRFTLAANSPGRIGENYFKFNDPENGYQGHSTQIQIACRCLDWNCRHAIVMQPRSRKLGPNRWTMSCFYTQVNGKWRDCHTEILRVSERGVDEYPDDFEGRGTYTVDQDRYGWWQVRGVNRHTEQLDETKTFETANFTNIEDYEKWTKNRKVGSFLCLQTTLLQMMYQKTNSFWRETTTKNVESYLPTRSGAVTIFAGSKINTLLEWRFRVI